LTAVSSWLNVVTICGGVVIGPNVDGGIMRLLCYAITLRSVSFVSKIIATISTRCVMALLIACLMTIEFIVAEMWQ
jgi:hypothetical protein